ncbi:hypothetical protein BJF79_14000 [Actinomadura sp. CNU-125]|uniref:McrC family protein n=1 Tax=Actinomadura sp. CNU-125 TaxID=1904961 RepID=UPI0009680387|nr:hypothetical protein [Actinomadura sp. CNU-125]OLT24065.1 hypothetical protein BJF79_14000 [Actinomadura sp. CNU-125]
MTVRLQEGAGWVERELTDRQAAVLGASGLVRITNGPRAGVWRLRDDGLVGSARVGGPNDAVDLHVAPKTPIDRLVFLLGYAQRPLGWRQDEVDAGERPDLLPALAHAFARAAERALRQGVLLGYREVEEPLAVVRGRVRVADQVRRRYGVPVPVEVRYDDYTPDTDENRLLFGAARRLMRLPGVPAETRRMLRHLLVRLDGVRGFVPGRPLPEWTPTRLNARYHTALGLAGMILRGASFELDGGASVRVDGLMLTMWRVFEDFVTAALADALRPLGGKVETQDVRHHLDHGRRVRLRPDLVHYGRDGRPRAAVDAKYKIETKVGKHEADLYQVLAYCTALGVKRGHLVYAAGDAVPHVHRIVGTADVRIEETALDLAASPDVLLARIGDLARRIGAGG